jgi:hypothetical protein
MRMLSDERRHARSSAQRSRTVATHSIAKSLAIVIALAIGIPAVIVAARSRV